MVEFFKSYKNKIRNGESFSEKDRQELQDCLDLSLQILEELGIEVEIISQVSIRDAIEYHCSEAEGITIECKV